MKKLTHQQNFGMDNFFNEMKSNDGDLVLDSNWICIGLKFSGDGYDPYSNPRYYSNSFFVYKISN